MVDEELSRPSWLDVVPPEDLPEIDAGNGDVAQVSHQAWDAILRANASRHLFRHGGHAVRIERADDGSAVLQTITPDRLTYVLARVARWYRRDLQGNKRPCPPPARVVRDMLARPELPLPVIHRVVEAPTVAADGTMMDTLGYNDVGGVFYVPRSGLAVPPVSNDPGADDLRRARALIVDDLLGDFPFVGDAERAHAVALLLLPFVRDVVIGATPVHLIEKPSPGTGGSLLADSLTYPFIGRPLSAMTEGHSEEEWRKRLSAQLFGGAALIAIDNLRHPLDSAALAAAITAPSWEDRILGRSEIIRVPVRCVWIVTGNNPTVSPEMARRTIRIRLDAGIDRPWLGRRFRHPDLRAWTAQHRAELIWAALTLARAWVAAGRPEESATLGMFESWSRVMGGILGVASISGFLGNIEAFYEAADGEGAAARAFLLAWHERHRDEPVTASQLYELAMAPDVGLDLQARSEQGSRVRLGKLLTSLRDRRFQFEGGVVLRVTAAGEHSRARVWRLLAVSNADGAPTRGHPGHDDHILEEMEPGAFRKAPADMDSGEGGESRESLEAHVPSESDVRSPDRAHALADSETHSETVPDWVRE